jgi:hypothetical protein
MNWDDSNADPISDIKAMIEKVKNSTGTIPEERPIVALWAYEYVNDHPTHEGCGGEWYPMGLHFWCLKCKLPLTRDLTNSGQLLSEDDGTGEA